MKLPKIITLNGLPLPNDGRLHPERSYTFWFGYPNYMPKNSKIILHIPEQPHRDANGRPLYPEQAQWIDALIREEKLAVTAVWPSHWRFDKPEAYSRFVKHLEKIKA